MSAVHWAQDHSPEYFGEHPQIERVVGTKLEEGPAYTLSVEWESGGKTTVSSIVCDKVAFGEALRAFLTK